MAETRKFIPPTSAIGDAVREALGDIRPTTPGEKLAAGQESEAQAPAAITISTANFTVLETLPDFLVEDPSGK